MVRYQFLVLLGAEGPALLQIIDAFGDFVEVEAHLSFSEIVSFRKGLVGVL